MRRRFLVNATVLLASVTAALLLAEAALRLSGRFPAAALHSLSSRQWSVVAGVWEPRQDVLVLDNPALPYRVRTNTLGLRGHEPSAARPAGRILCIGDSLTFGDFVEDDETLPARIEARLGPAVEVLNGGVGGSTIVDQQAFLRKMLAVRPDAVLLLYSENDLRDLLNEVPLHVALARNRALKGGLLAPLFTAFRDTALFNLAIRLRGAVRTWEATRPAATGPGSAYAARFDELLDRYARTVVEVRDELAGRRVAFVFATFPSWHRLARVAQPRETIGPLARALAARGVEAIDLTPALRATGLTENELYLLPHDGHPSARAYAIASEPLAERLRDVLASRT